MNEDGTVRSSLKEPWMMPSGMPPLGVDLKEVAVAMVSSAVLDKGKAEGVAGLVGLPRVTSQCLLRLVAWEGRKNAR